MAAEIYIPWYCEKLSYPMVVSLKGFSCNFNSNYALEIYVYNVKKHDENFAICFPELPIAMRITNESQRLITIRQMERNFEHFICTVKNSNFLKWLNTESVGIYENDPWNHFSISADDEWIDIITSDIPEIHNA